MSCLRSVFFFFFFNDTATTEIYTLSLHDALPILGEQEFYASHSLMNTPTRCPSCRAARKGQSGGSYGSARGDRKSTRLNSSHQIISYAVFCLKKKNT